MTSFLEVLLYRELIEKVDTEEVDINVLENALEEYFSLGATLHVIIETLDSIHGDYKLVEKVLNFAPELYNDSTYGSVKMLDWSEKEGLLNFLKSLIQEEVSDIDKLLDEGSRELEELLGLYNNIKHRWMEDSKLIINYS